MLILILHKTVADDVNLTAVADDEFYTKQLQAMLILHKTVADDVNFTQNSCRRC